MDWVQLHLALNHVPVIGIPIIVVLLAVGWTRASEDVLRVSLWSLVVLSALAIGIKFTGDFAAEQAAAQFVAVKTHVERHEETGDQATTGVFLLGLASALALWLARRRKPIRKWSLALVLVLGIFASLLYARSAHTGGEISHPELRDGP